MVPTYAIACLHMVHLIVETTALSIYDSLFVFTRHMFFHPSAYPWKKKKCCDCVEDHRDFYFFFYEPLHEVFLDRRDATEISLISFSSEFEKLVLHSVTSSYKKVHLHGFRHLCFSLELEALIKFIFLIKCALFCFLSFCFSECIWPI